MSDYLRTTKSDYWIETRSGKQFDFVDPQPDSIDIDDIAYALANQCRFTGHVRFYSVAEHSVLVAGRVTPDLRLAALLHDASEAYLGDVSSPLKSLLPDYRKIEHRVDHTIRNKFGVDCGEDGWQAIKRADLDALVTEAHYLLESKGKTWGDWTHGLKIEPEYEPRCLPPAQAYRLFKAAYNSLVEEDGPRLHIVGA